MMMIKSAPKNCTVNTNIQILGNISPLTFLINVDLTGINVSFFLEGALQTR